MYILLINDDTLLLSILYPDFPPGKKRTMLEIQKTKNNKNNISFKPYQMVRKLRQMSSYYLSVRVLSRPNTYLNISCLRFLMSERRRAPLLLYISFRRPQVRIKENHSRASIFVTLCNTQCGHNFQTNFIQWCTGSL